jgi:hypothetical protein
MAAVDLLFEVRTPLGFSVVVTRTRWELIATTKHPVMRGRESSADWRWSIRRRFARAEAMRRYSSSTRRRPPRRWVCAVTRRCRDRAFLVTAYPTDAIKEGIRVWPT